MLERWSKWLGSILDQPGALLYSAVDTLSRGDYYIIGVNPGGVGGTHTIADALRELPKKVGNSYLDECWAPGGRELEAGESPLQRRVKYLASLLPGAAENPLNSICATNLVFTQTRAVRDLDFHKLADVCWPVHEDMLAIVSPRLILAFGNSALSPYTVMKDRLGARNEQCRPSGHGHWQLRMAEVDLPGGRKAVLAGLPHLSRYSPIGRRQVEMLLQDATAGYI